MQSPALFGLNVAFSFVAWSAVAWSYIWPALKKRPAAESLKPILLLHSFRFIGLAFLVPGVVSAELPTAFTRPDAYGDLITAILALLALATLETRIGSILAWSFNVFGTADILLAFYHGNQISLANSPGQLGAAYFIVTFLVPLLLVTHGLVFLTLLKARSAALVQSGLRTA